nr:MAG: replication-associated protein [Canine stool-associated circular virus]WDW25919.1 MAG: replication-associated protein [Canine stool-associated circular virus]
MSETEQAQGTSTAGNTSSCRGKKQRSYFITFWTHDYPRVLPKSPECQYMCTCEDSTKDGKYHGHAFVYFKNPVSLSRIKKLFGNECHVEKPVKNSDCIAYVLDTTKRKCNFQEFGKRPMNNGVHAMEEILECDTVDQVKEQFPDTYVKFRKGIIDLIEHKKSKNRYYKQPEVIWICGSTGSGKTRLAFEDGAMNVTYENGFYSDWGDARVICIEEFRGQIPYAEMLKLLDGYHNYYFVNIKGGQKLIDLDKIYITSPYMPEMCYPKQNEKIDSIKQLMRRITKLINTDI